MKRVQTIFMAAAMLLGTVAMAQKTSVEPRYEKEGDLIKATFYYEDGTVSQVGTYKNGVLHGKWTAYDRNGQKTTIANYDQGQKSGKWFFYLGTELKEVDYNANQIASINTWKNEKSLAGNE